MAIQLDLSPDLLAYVRSVSLRDDDVLRDLRAETADLPAGVSMQVPAEEGQFLALLVALIGARTVVEIGTFTGYSTLCMARALPPTGRLITCDITGRWPDIGAGYWRRAGVADRIEVRIGAATDTLAALTAQLGGESVDLVFIDADKPGYPAYYEASLALLRPGGLVVLDNTLCFGRAVDPSAIDAENVAVRRVNDAIHADPRVDMVLLPLADGVTLVRKR